MASTLLLIGFGAGAAGALVGIGGGVLLVPALTLLMGLDLKVVIPISLMSVVATSVSSAAVYLRKDRVDIVAGVRLQFYTVMGAVTAGLLAPLVPQDPLFMLFGVLLVITSLRIWPGSMPAPGGVALNRPLRMPLASVVSVFAGGLAGLLGIGGGILNAPVLHILLDLPFDRAAATSAFMIGGTASAAALVYMMRGDLELHMTAFAVLGTLTGAWLGARLQHKIRPRRLQQGFAVLLLYAALRMVLKGIG